ncbi:unnamed protein product [Sphagnum troendelagicum]|uniref:Core-2/I-branching beta-1,6-N-acetylglucosaminyltransferase family protein n=1 Tax=Sphagnum troendelagicum TaxID=128251 RepID=A0ABP0UZ42_9BRYO
MKKRVSGYPRWRWRAGAVLFVGSSLVILFLLKLQSLVLDNSLDDVLLTSHRDTGSTEYRNSTKPKLAFMFLARESMPLDILWQHFFEGSHEHEYSVYIHARPGYVYTKTATKCHAFINRQIKKPIQVWWGEATMIEAERLLLSAALQDPLNLRFLLLSDSCIPLYNFGYVYDYVMSSHKSFVDSFVDYNDTQYNSKMSSVIPKGAWRKGSQWFVLIRKHAEKIVTDSLVFPVFQNHCKVYLFLDLALPVFGQLLVNKTQENCIPDEHYIQTLLAMQEMETEIERRTLTYTWWENSKSGKGREGWHPVTFNTADATLKTITNIQNVNNVRYDTESRIEWCSSEGQPRPCYLFARKFTRGAAFQLLDLVPSYEKAEYTH